MTAKVKFESQVLGLLSSVAYTSEWPTLHLHELSEVSLPAGARSDCNSVSTTGIVTLLVVTGCYLSAN